MQDALQIMNRINWFLKPVKELILFLFTTKTGIFILVSVFILLLVYATYREIKYKSLLYEAARRRKFVGLGEIIWTFFTQIVNFFIKLINNVTVVLVVLVLLLAIVGMSSAFDAVDNYVEQQQRLSEMKTVLKNLNKSYEVAKIKVLNYDYKTNTTTLEVKFYDYLKKGYGNNKQEIKIIGRNIYFQFLVLNFEYSQIENGEKINLAIPMKVFSEEIESRNGIPLQITDSLGVPLIYKRSEEELYGIEKEKYDKYLKEIADYMHDPELARKEGVRSITANSTHIITYKGLTYKIYVEQTGGIVLKKAENW